jgi:GNAT superfamily N-acetyltransferase
VFVREATLDDTQDIVAVHLTSPDRPFDHPLESLSVAARYAYGGPWMSVETCAIHLNNLLAWGHVPLVVEEGDRVIAEVEFYVGRDIPPLGTTLDISVLFIHADYQRRGAGTLLMEELISRARRRNCDHMTVSGGLGAPAVYRRFAFGPALNLEPIDRDLPDVAPPGFCEPYMPAGLELPPSATLWIGRFLSPTRKWREIVDRAKSRDAILPKWAQRPKPAGFASECIGFLGFLVSTWGNADEVDLHCWSETLTRETVRHSWPRFALPGTLRRACSVIRA